MLNFENLTSCLLKRISGFLFGILFDRQQTILWVVKFPNRPEETMMKVELSKTGGIRRMYEQLYYKNDKLERRKNGKERLTNPGYISGQA